MKEYKNFVAVEGDFLGKGFTAIHSKKADYMFRNSVNVDMDNISSMIVFEHDLRIDLSLSLPDDLYWMECAHGDCIIDLEEYEEEFNYFEVSLGRIKLVYPGIKCDGIITSDKNKVLALLTADCMPVYLVDATNNVFGLVHSGWKGTLLSIVPKAIRKMVKKGAKLENIKVVIGPSISIKAFEVDSDVAHQFVLYMNRNLINEASFMFKKGEKYHINLSGILKEVLRKEGINVENNLLVSNDCTYLNMERDEYKYHSYRRDKADSGRNISILMYKDDEKQKCFK